MQNSRRRFGRPRPVELQKRLTFHSWDLVFRFGFFWGVECKFLKNEARPQEAPAV